MKSDERRQAIRQQRERLIQDLEAVYMAAFDRLGELEGEVGEVKAAQLTQMILNSKTAAIEPLEKEIEKPVITTPGGRRPPCTPLLGLRSAAHAAV